MAPRGRGGPYSKGGNDGKGKAGKDCSEKDKGKNKSNYKGNDKVFQPLADKGKTRPKGNDKGKDQPLADERKGKGVQPLADGKHTDTEEFLTLLASILSSIYDFPDHKRGRAAGLVGKLFALMDQFVDVTTDDQERMGGEEAARNALIEKTIVEVEDERVRLQQQLRELWEEELHAGSGSSGSSSSNFHNNNNNNNSDIATSSDTAEESKVTPEEFTLFLHDAQQALAARRSMVSPESQADAINAAFGAE